MFFSKSKFFNQSPHLLRDKKKDVQKLLLIKGIASFNFLKAYDFFVKHPTGFDGATIVKDLKDIKGLDLSAMVHDYNYLVDLPKYKSWRWLKHKFKIDFDYGKNMETLGKGILTPYLRTIGLILSTPIYYLITRIKEK